MYTVKNHKKDVGGADTVTTKEYTNFTHLSELLTKSYFTEKNVFEYVLSKTDDSVIKAYPNEFASSFYALAKQTGVLPKLFLTIVALNLIKHGIKLKMPVNICSLILRAV